MKNAYVNAVDFFKNKSIPDAEGAHLILAAYQLRTPENVGALIRLAGNLNIEKVLFIQGENSMRMAKINRVAHSSLGHVDFSFVTEDVFFTALPTDYQLVAIETAEHAENIYQAKLPQKCVLVVGSERHGMAQDFLNKIPNCVYIPLVGKTRSLNVSHAATIAAFEWGRQHLGLAQL